MDDNNTPELKEDTSSSQLSYKLKPHEIIAASIILGAAIISASIIYAAGIVSRNSAADMSSNQVAATTTAAAPAVKVDVTDRADEPVLGNPNAKVTVEEFGDFQCPYCKNFFQQTFPQIKKQYIDTGKIKYVFRHFPLTQIHINAQISAVAAECANEEGKFWDYHDMLYSKGQSDGTALDKASLEKYATQIGLNKSKFNQCLETNATLKTVQADQAEGSKDGVKGTPSFFINGSFIEGAKSFDIFSQAIDSALK